MAQHGGLAKPDLAAPGVQVVSSVPGGRFTPMDGCHPPVHGRAGGACR